MNQEFSTTDKFVVLITSFVAVTALIVSVWQGIEMRKHNRLSVKPMLNFSRNFNGIININGNDTTDSREFQLIMANNGIGPCIIKSFTIYYDGLKVEDENDIGFWTALDKEIPESLEIKQASWFNEGDVFGQGLSKSLIKCKYLPSFFKRIKLVIIYESIYEEEYRVETAFMN